MAKSSSHIIDAAQITAQCYKTTHMRRHKAKLSTKMYDTVCHKRKAPTAASNESLTGICTLGEIQILRLANSRRTHKSLTHFQQ